MVVECVPNVSEGRDAALVDDLALACGPSLLDAHRDPDHHRSVFTLLSPRASETGAAARSLARAVSERLDVSAHTGVHPRMGALDVVPFVALAGTDARVATVAALEFGEWAGSELAVPVFYYGDADAAARSLPETRSDAFLSRGPDVGPDEPHPTLGAVAVGARPPLVAVNVELDTPDVAVARAIAREVRERDGGLPGVRALGFALASRHHTQVSMNLVDLPATGLEAACTVVRARVEAAGASVVRVEIVGLVPRTEYERTSPSFRAWAALDEDRTIEARLGR